MLAGDSASVDDTTMPPPIALVEQAYDEAHANYFDPNNDVEIMEEDVDAGKIKDVGINMIRAATVGTHPRFVQMDMLDSTFPGCVVVINAGDEERAAHWGSS